MTTFIIRSVIVGLAAAFVVVMLRPDLVDPGNVIEIHEVTESHRHASGMITSYADAVDIAAPAVVNIHSQKVVTKGITRLFSSPAIRRMFGDAMPVPRRRLESSLGSGVIISPQGYLLTSYHNIAGADAIEVALRDGRSFRAEVVGKDEATDLAILHVDATDLPAITIGDSRGARVGDIVLAIGNPFGLGHSVTQGIISATGRDNVGITTFENYIQTDAAINPGNSGGALIDMNGHLIGINSIIYSKSGGSQGIGFAIPVELARTVMTSIIKYGRVIRGWIGVGAENLAPILTRNGVPVDQGVVISGIIENGPADNAGLEVGDIITAIGQQPIEDIRQLRSIISATEPGSQIELKILRDNESLSVATVVAERPRTIRLIR